MFIIYSFIKQTNCYKKKIIVLPYEIFYCCKKSLYKNVYFTTSENSEASYIQTYSKQFFVFKIYLFRPINFYQQQIYILKAKKIIRGVYKLVFNF